MGMNKDIPQEVIFTDDWQYDPFLDSGVHYKVATCPNCKNYPLYGENPCPYCGQKLILPKVDRKPPKVVGGVIDEDGHIVCDCGSKLLTMTSHFDGRKEYGSSYTCENGHRVDVIEKRRRSNVLI